MRSLSACVLGLAILTACGGRVEGGDDASSPPASSGDGGGGGATEGGSPSFGLCPTEPPTIGQACAVPNHGCAYTDYGGKACQAYLCDGTGHWANTSGGC